MKQRVTLLAGMLVVVCGFCAAKNALAAESSDEWAGTYHCSDMERNITITFMEGASAQVEVAPGEGADLFSVAQYTAEVERNENEWLISSDEWIQKSSIPMVDFKVSVDEGSMQGLVLHENCGDVTLEKQTPVEQAAIDASVPDGQFPMYFTGVYQCPRGQVGLYWKLDKNAEGNLGLDYTRRSFNQTGRPEFHQFVLTLNSEGKYSGMVESRDFGVDLNFTTKDKPPVIEWLGRDGNPASDKRSCESPLLISATEPRVYWDTFLELANATHGEIEQTKAAVLQYRTLPHTDMLSATDSQSYSQNLAPAWNALQQNYNDNIATGLFELPVATADERLAARKTIGEIANPGFDHQFSYPSLYVKHLMASGIKPESLYFSDTDAACKRVREDGSFRSKVKNIVWFVGLPAQNFDKETIESTLETIEQCAGEDPALKVNADRAIKSIKARIPALEKENAKVRWLSEQKDLMIAMPKGFDTLQATNGYEVEERVLRSKRITKETYQQHFTAFVAEARQESIQSATIEIQGRFSSNASTIKELRGEFKRCQEHVGETGYNLPDWHKALHTACEASAQDSFKKLVHRLREHINVHSEVEGEESIVTFLERPASQELSDFGRRIKMAAVVARYKSDLMQRKEWAGASLRVKLQQYFELNTEQGDEQVVRHCSNSKIARFLKNECRTLRQGMADRNAQQQ